MGIKLKEGEGTRKRENNLKNLANSVKHFPHVFMPLGWAEMGGRLLKPAVRPSPCLPPVGGQLTGANGIPLLKKGISRPHGP